MMRGQLNEEKGIILPIVLILTLALMITGLVFISLGVQENSLVRREIAKRQAFYLAEGGIEHGIWALNNEDHDEQQEFTVNSDEGIVVGDYEVTVSSSTVKIGEANEVTVLATGYVPSKNASSLVKRSVSVKVRRLGADIFDSAIFEISELTNSGIELPEVVPPTSFDYEHSALVIPAKKTESISEGGTHKYPNMKINGTLNINATGVTVIIYVEGGLDVKGQGKIYIVSGCSVIFYVGGNVKVAGQAIVNDNKDPSTLGIYATGECENVRFTGGSYFYGVVYAPEVNFDIVGGAIVYGSLAGETINVSGSSEIYYDERAVNLTNAPQFLKNFKFVSGSWREIESS